MKNEERVEFVSELRAAADGLDNDDEFARLIRMAADEFDDKELSTLFSVARSTVSRWRSGKSTPHLMFKQRVYQVLIERVDVKAKHGKRHSTRAEPEPARRGEAGGARTSAPPPPH